MAYKGIAGPESRKNPFMMQNIDETCAMRVHFGPYNLHLMVVLTKFMDGKSIS